MGRSAFVETCMCVMVAAALLLMVGALQAREQYLMRGISSELPQPIAHGGVRLGVNVRLEQYDDAQLAQNLREIAESPFTHIKQPFFYSENFDWAASDQVMTAVQNYPELEIVPLLDGDPSTQFAAPNIDSFTKWTTEFATRYGEQIDHYIVWDEPNLTSHWGGKKVNPDVYAAVLTSANRAIKAVDPVATIVAAPLAPTTEYRDSVNMADTLFLQRLYEAGAEFDVAAGKPYGFDHPPSDRRVDVDLLNFSRVILLREVMERNGDGGSALWAGNWGWNTHEESIWGEVTTAEQIGYTNGGIVRARSEWDWMGAMFLESWEPIEGENEPIWGFSVRGVVGSLTAEAQREQSSGGVSTTEAQRTRSLPTSGFYEARADGAGQSWKGDWVFADGVGADSSEKYVENGDVRDSMTFTFYGTDVGVLVRRADFRARYYVTVDGEPANGRPRDEHGTAIVLDAADPAADYMSMETIATGLPLGEHTVEIIAHRGWGQFALHGFSVGVRPETHSAWVVPLLGALAIGCLSIAIWRGKDVAWTGRWARGKARFERFSRPVQMGLIGAMGTILTVSGIVTWWTGGESLFRRLGDVPQFALTATAASIFYVSPWFIVYGVALVVLVVLISFRPVHGVTLVAFAIPFYARPGTFTTGDGFYKDVLNYPFSPVEILVWVLVVGYCLGEVFRPKARRGKNAKGLGAVLVAVGAFVGEQFDVFGDVWWGAAVVMPFVVYGLIKAWCGKVNRVDWAVIGLVGVAAGSLLFTNWVDVARNEFWWVIVEPALFYVVVRGVFSRTKVRRHEGGEVWQVVDGFVASGVVVAVFGLGQLLVNGLMGDGGVMRVQSFYGSPNNVALYLGRIVPILIGVVFFTAETQRSQRFFSEKRRWVYGVCAAVCSLVFLLTLSKGGILLGAPAALFVLAVIWFRKAGRNPVPFVIGAVVLGVVAWVVAFNVPGLSARLALTGETSFARTYLWRSSVEMIRENPVFGVGLDNFLYEYRGRYILESAWKEPNLNHPHNLIFDFGTRLGLVGLAVGGALFGVCGRMIWRLIRADNCPVWVYGIAGAFAYTLAHGLVDHVYFLVDLAFAFMLMLALLVNDHGDQSPC